MFLFILLSKKDNTIIKKENYKKYIIKAFSCSNSKIVLILLAKVIIFYMEYTTVHV